MRKDYNETQVSDILEASRRMNLGQYKEDVVMEAKLTSSTPRREGTENVRVDFVPSTMVNVYVDSWFDQITRVFRGNMRDLRPVLSLDDSLEKDLLCRYMETLFWKKMISINKKYCKGELNNLKKAIERHVAAPALFANAVACIGICVSRTHAIRLMPDFDPSYDWKSRLLSIDDWNRVTDWILELSNFGFQCYEGFNASEDGVLDFMLMCTISDELEDEEEDEDDDYSFEEDREETEFEEESKSFCRFVVQSQRASSNIIALYRYFFYTQRIKYISDSRLVYTYSDFDSTEDTIKYIVKNMIYKNEVPKYLVDGENQYVKSSREVSPEPIEKDEDIDSDLED